MAFNKLSLLLVAVVAAIGVSAQQDFDDAEPQWPADGISPLDSLAYWDTDAQPDEEETNDAAKGCCLPKTWTATIFSEVKRQGGRKQEGRAIRFAEVSYVDENTKRVAVDVTVPRGPRKNATKVSYILLFNNNASATLYAFSKTASKCYKKVLKNAQFRSMCLPQNSTLLASYSLGAGTRALRSQSWGFLARDRRTTIVGSAVITPDNCVPILVGEKAFIRPRMTDDEDDVDRKRPQVVSIGALYTNFVTQIRDPSVFTPPSYCKRADDTLLFDSDVDFTTIIQRFVTVPY